MEKKETLPTSNGASVTSASTPPPTRPVSILKKHYARARGPETGGENCLKSTLAIIAANRRARAAERSGTPASAAVKSNCSRSSTSSKDVSKKATPQQPNAIPKASGNDMKKLLGELYSSRMQIEEDQREYEKCRREVDKVEKKTVAARQELRKLKETFQAQTTVLAMKRAECRSAEVRKNILEQGLKDLQDEFNCAVEERTKIRSEALEKSSSHLADSLQFAMMWNSTKLGQECRVRHHQEEFENLQREKRQLEIELEDFLTLKKGTEESEKEKEMLEQKYKEHDETVRKQENELQLELDALDLSILDLEREEEEFRRSFEEESETLKCKIEEVQASVKTLQRNAEKSNAAVPVKRSVQGFAGRQPTSLALIHQSTKKNVIEVIDIDCETGSSMVQKVNETQTSFAKFQPPIKSRPNNDTNSVESSSNNTTEHNPSESGSEGFSYSNDEDLCLAAAMEVSQALKTKSYEPMPPTPAYAPPLKVRVVERPHSTQVPITSYLKPTKPINCSSVTPTRPSTFKMNQTQIETKLSSYNKPASTAPSQQLSNPGRKTFHFKKKIDNSANNGLYGSSSNDSSMVFSSSLNALGGTGNDPVNDERNEGQFGDKPFSTFTSSRLFLSDSQVDRLL